MTAGAGLLMMFLAAAPAQAPKDTPSALALAKRVDVEYVETPFGEAVQHLAQLAGFKIFLDGNGLEEGWTNAPISFEIGDAPAGEVLRWLTRKAGVHYEIGREVITISSQQALMRRRAELRIYSIRDLTGGRDSSAWPEDDSRTWPRSCVLVHGLMLIDEPPPSAICSTPSGIAEFLSCTVRPGCWHESLGTSIEERGGKLLITATPEMHDEIAQVLERVRRVERRMVTVRVRVLQTPTGLVDHVLDGASPTGILPPKAIARLDVMAGAEPERILASARFTCMNGRRGRTSSGRQTDYVSGYAFSGGKYDPVVRRVISGLGADVLAVISDDGQSILLELRLSYSAPGRTELREFRLVEKSESGVQSSKGASDPLSLLGTIQECSLALAKIRTSARLPSGGTLLLSVPTLPGRDSDGTEELVFLVTATAVTF